MAKERIVRATFSNGAVNERGSISKIYTHAYCAIVRNAKGQRPSYSGFSTSAAQCERNMNSEMAWTRKQPGSVVEFAEVVAVEVIEKRSRPTDAEQLASLRLA